MTQKAEILRRLPWSILTLRSRRCRNTPIYSVHFRLLQLETSRGRKCFRVHRRRRVQRIIRYLLSSTYLEASDGFRTTFPSAIILFICSTTWVLLMKPWAKRLARLASMRSDLSTGRITLKLCVFSANCYHSFCSLFKTSPTVSISRRPPRD